MKSSTTSSLFLVAAIAGGVATTFLASSALADDITMDNARFVSTKSLVFAVQDGGDQERPHPAGGNS
jgi:hypothetical protein